VEDKPNGNPIENDADSAALQSTDTSAHLDGIQEPKQEAGKPKTNEQESKNKQPSRTQRIWLWMKVKAEKAGLHDWLMVLFTAVLAFFAASQFAISCSSSKQTADLIAAANTQACAAQHFADSASSINTGIASAVGKLDAQAKATQRTIIENRDASYRGLRPYVHIATLEFTGNIVKSETLRANAYFVNSGRTPALDLHGCGDIVILANASPITDDYPCPAPQNPKRVDIFENPKYVLGPNAPAWIVSSPDTTVLAEVSPNLPGAFEQLIANGGLRVYFYGEVAYRDTINMNVIHHTSFCGRYNPIIKRLVTCEKHNRMD